MKIALVTMEYSKSAGIPRYVVELAERFSKKNEVHVFTSNYAHETKRIHLHKYSVPKKPYPLKVAANTLRNTLAVEISDKREHFDVINSQGTGSLKTHVATMQSCHRYWTNYKKQNGHKTGITDRLINLIEKKVVEKKSERIVAISEKVKKEITASYNVPEEKILVIHSGVNLKEFDPKNREKYLKKIRKRHGIGENDIVLSFVGWYFERKGLSQLIQAVEKTGKKNIKLLVVGGGDKKDFQQQAQSLGLGQNIVFAGTRPEVNQYYAASDAFVFPTVYEPFGLVITEAMASGLPVITSEIAGAAELITDGKDGLLLRNPKDPSEIAEKIQKILPKAERKKIGKAARKTAEKYSWDNMAEKTMQLYEEVAKR